uniref:Protein kinase domain-containing protein n=1 Tax=Oryza glaberrima TaxID=4538 RepID=I1PDU9_ORYGL
MSLPGCPDKCGDVSIPYPFGIGDRCAAAGLSRFFNLTCDGSRSPPVPMLGDPGAQADVIDFSSERGELRLYAGLSYACYASSATSPSTNATFAFSLVGTPFRVSPSRNRLTVVGCSALGLVVSTASGGGGDDDDLYATGCFTYCAELNAAGADGAPCAGAGCCQVPISPDIPYLGAAFRTGNWTNTAWRFNPCFYAMVAEDGWYSFRRRDLVGVLAYYNETVDAGRGVPVVIDWAVRDGWCPATAEERARRKYACVSGNSDCVNSSNGMGYTCNCSRGSEGNPYLAGGCQDINECVLREQDPKYEEMYPCRHGICINTPGLSACAILAMALSCLLVIQLQRRKHIQEKQQYFKQNGGLRLFDEMVSRQVDTVRVLTEDELKKATNNFSDDQVIGCGGHGTVYRGTLDDLREVAIKRPKAAVDGGGGGGCEDEFVNEIIVLSQINHRHVVRLLGCCLEVHVPMLVYEFVPNGTLFELLHGGTAAGVAGPPAEDRGAVRGGAGVPALVGVARDPPRRRQVPQHPARRCARRQGRRLRRVGAEVRHGRGRVVHRVRSGHPGLPRPGELRQPPPHRQERRVQLRRRPRGARHPEEGGVRRRRRLRLRPRGPEAVSVHRVPRRAQARRALERAGPRAREAPR